MGICKYCGKPAGLLRHQHKKCREQHDNATQKILEFFREALTSTIAPTRFQELTDEIARKSYIKDQEYKNLVALGFANLIDAALADKLLSQDEDKRVDALRDAFKMNLKDLPTTTAYKYAKGTMLRQLEEGKFPSAVPHVEGYNPINLERGEKIMWIFNNAEFFTQRKRTEYVGATQGASIRLMRGVYYKVGSFKGAPVQKQYLASEGIGDFFISDRNIYCYSKTKSVKVPIRKIISIEPYADGISLSRDGANAKPYIFTVDDPWFAANAISRLNQINSG
jgi:hypothetical protein